MKVKENWKELWNIIDEIGVEKEVLKDKVKKIVNKLVSIEIGEEERIIEENNEGIIVNKMKDWKEIGRKIGIVDEKNIRMDDEGEVIERNIVERGKVDKIDEEIDERGDESESKVIEEDLKKKEIGVGKIRINLIERGKVNDWVLEKRSVRKEEGLKKEDEVLDKKEIESEMKMIGIIGGKDVIGDEENEIEKIDKDWKEGLDDGSIEGEKRKEEEDERNFFNNIGK